MTEISRFYGIIIRMYAEGGLYHHRPHIHVYFQGRSTSYGLDNWNRFMVIYPAVSVAWSRHGLSSIYMNFLQIGRR
ncbi:MAG: DUF4160 domain-containing protein [Caldilineaceae bacterium]|nr:DUF4160 domain-containing protein [Caldilineaceae bacterium]